MELLRAPVLNAMATVIAVCVSLALLVTSAVWIPKVSRQHFWLLFLPIFAFALLGFITGYIMGDSRESAVSSVLPAILTLLGGITIYIVGSRGSQRQTAVSSMLIIFVVSLFLGTQFGAWQRVNFENALNDPERLREQALALEQNRNAVEVQQLLNYIQILKFKRDFGEQEKLDLSRFESALESKAESKK